MFNIKFSKIDNRDEDEDEDAYVDILRQLYKNVSFDTVIDEEIYDMCINNYEEDDEIYSEKTLKKYLRDDYNENYYFEPLSSGSSFLLK